MRNILDKICRVIQSTHFTFNNFFFFLKIVPVYEKMPKNMVEPEGPQLTSQYGAYELHAG
jgi:hypothetical protein